MVSLEKREDPNSFADLHVLLANSEKPQTSQVVMQ